MMKKLVLLAPLALASCGLLGAPKGDVMGSINGTQPRTGDVRMALVGVTTSGFENNSVDQLDIGTFNPAKRVYTISLPNSPKAGAYDVIAYVDSDGDSRYDVGEPRTQPSGKTIIYATRDASLFGYNVKQGWNVVQGGQVITSGLPFTNYNLSW